MITPGMRIKAGEMKYTGGVNCGTPTRSHTGVCPICESDTDWEQHTDFWTENDEDDMKPDWKMADAWHCYCENCGAYCVDPYGDGLIRVWFDEERFW